jgi:hypothetical protein
VPARWEVDNAAAPLKGCGAARVDSTQLSLLSPIALLLRNPESDLALNGSSVSIHGASAFLEGARMIGRFSRLRMLEAGPLGAQRVPLHTHEAIAPHLRPRPRRSSFWHQQQA